MKIVVEKWSGRGNSSRPIWMEQISKRRIVGDIVREVRGVLVRSCLCRPLENVEFYSKRKRTS